MQIMIKNMNLDWEDVVTRALGPVPAQLIIKTFTVARAQWLTTRQSVRRQTTDFLSTDQKVVLTKPQLDMYTLRISDLMKRIDRLNAKVRRAAKDE